MATRPGGWKIPRPTGRIWKTSDVLRLVADELDLKGGHGAGLAGVTIQPLDAGCFRLEVWRYALDGPSVRFALRPSDFMAEDGGAGIVREAIERLFGDTDV